jgi:hypothetical protein
MAALLNSASPDVSYDLGVAQVVDLFNEAFASGNDEEIEELKDIFNFFNEQGCPLD